MTVTYWDDPSLAPTFISFPPARSLWRRFVSWMIGEPAPRPWSRPEASRPEDYQPMVKACASPKPVQPSPISPLSDLRICLRALTYGEFIAYCEGTGGDPDAVWAWANKGE
jgi:hypothetical protein